MVREVKKGEWKATEDGEGIAGRYFYFIFLIMLQAKDFFSSFAPRNTEVAQLVEYRSPKPAVGGSSPSFRAKYKSRGFKSLLFLFLMVIAKIIKIGIYALLRHYRCLKQILYFIHFLIKIEKIRQIEFYLLTLS